jgi:hypothetical protein
MRRTDVAKHHVGAPAVRASYDGDVPQTAVRRVPSRSEPPMSLSLSFAPLVSLIAGILILIVPRLLNYIVAIYLILIGIIGIFGVGTPRID